ncbi:MAG: hypothetical protein FWF47_03570 [Clostridia bacterium]|nr:hypothetical protein [Clostridia bacterium]
MNDFTKEPPQGVIANMLGRLTNTTGDLEEKILLNKDTASEPTVSDPNNAENSDVIELDGDFDLEGYEVVRREFYAHTKEPSVTFVNYKIYVNAACLNRFQSVDYMLAMVNRRSQTLLLRPSCEEDRAAVSWCVPGSVRRKPRQITCKMLYANLFALMGWNPNYRYKLLGKIVHAKNGYFITFDLKAPEMYQCVPKDDVKTINSHTPLCHAEWQGQFGLPYEEHQKSMQINIVDGYAFYAIKDSRIVQIEDPSKELPPNHSDNAAYVELTGDLNDE